MSNSSKQSVLSRNQTSIVSLIIIFIYYIIYLLISFFLIQLKKFKLKKCIRNLLKCKSIKNNNENYEYVNYGYGQTTLPPLSSTAISIDTKVNKQFNYLKELSEISNDDSASLGYSSSSSISNSESSSFISYSIISQSNTSLNSLLNPVLSSTFIDFNYINEINSLIVHLSSILNVNPTITHVCSKDYEAKFVSDLSIRTGNPIQILQEIDDWLYVQLVNNNKEQQQGYVPKENVIHIQKFISNLKENISILKSFIINPNINKI